MISITVDPKALITTMGAAANQLPFATAKALNECAVGFQTDERAVMQQDFIIRRPWVLQRVKIDRGDFATKTKLSVRIRIDDQGDFLNKFEGGGIRTPLAGRRGLVIPLTGGAAKRSPQSIVPDKLRPKNLAFKTLQSKGGFQILKGDQRTFLIQRPDGSGVILQRKGSKVAVKRRHQGPLMAGQRRDYSLVVLFTIKPRTRVPDSLHFYDTPRTAHSRRAGRRPSPSGGTKRCVR
jgi:hypothetical protein